MAHKWIGTGSLTRVDGDDVAPGDEFEPTEAELKSFADAIESVDDSPPDDESENAASESDDSADTTDSDSESVDNNDDALSEITDEHWRSVVSAIETGEYDDRLEEIASEDGRESVQEAIAERKAEL